MSRLFELWKKNTWSKVGGFFFCFFVFFYSWQVGEGFFFCFFVFFFASPLSARRGVQKSQALTKGGGEIMNGTHSCCIYASRRSLGGLVAVAACMQRSSHMGCVKNSTGVIGSTTLAMTIRSELSRTHVSKWKLSIKGISNE